MIHAMMNRLIPETIFGRLSFFLNGTMMVLFIVFLIYDYEQDSADRLNRKYIALEEQASLLLPGIRNRTKPEAIQAYISESQKSMASSHSESHIVGATIHGDFFQSGMVREEEANTIVGLQNSK